MGRRKKQIELNENKCSSLLHNSKYHPKAEVHQKCQAIRTIQVLDKKMMLLISEYLKSPFVIMSTDTV